MAVTVYDYEKNQWFVQRVNGMPEPCHNATTAKSLCRQYNKEEEAEWRKTVSTIHAFHQEVHQEVV